MLADPATRRRLPPYSQHVPGVVFHHTDTARLPWILASRELRAGSNKIGGYPDPDFLWATVDGRGDATASAHRGAEYRADKVGAVRFTLDEDDFFCWAEAYSAHDAWTGEHIKRLEAGAKGKSNPDDWLCRSTPLGRWLAVETRSYRDNRWKTYSLVTELLRFTAPDGGKWLGVDLGDKWFWSRQTTGPQGQDAYEIRAVMAGHGPLTSRAAA